MTQVDITARAQSQEVLFRIGPGEYSMGRSNQADLQLPAAWRLASGRHLTIRVSDTGELAVRDGHGGQKSTNGTRLNNRHLDCQAWVAWQAGAELQIGSGLQEGIRIDCSSNPGEQATTHAQHSPSGSAPDTVMWIGRSEECDVSIQGATISRRHCVIRKGRAGSTITDHSRNGIFINDQRVLRPQLLQDGDEIKIGTHVFGWIQGKLIKQTSGQNYRVDVRDLVLPGRISGSSLSIEPGQLVAFVGGSGAGKSSLLTTIVGQNMDYRGNILINGHELRDCYPAIKQEIGFVPQDDIVHSDLTVEEVLRYSARLKLPDPEQQRAGVERVLNELEMQKRRHARVKELSGGQRKRVSIGVELIADPRILFLDEPTSGLDPGLDKRMMQMLRRLADSGKTVALVTHATNNVMLCDQVVFLGRGGHLCYAGHPAQCGSHFGVQGDFADLYQYLEKSDVEIRQLADHFKTMQRQQLPQASAEARALHTGAQNDLAGRLKQLPVQLNTLLSRDIKLQSRDLTSLGLNAITAPLATAMIAIAANNREIFNSAASAGQTTYPDALRILFVIICSTVWVGLSTSLQSIVKERAIFIRERAFNLLPEAYLASKALVMAGQAVLQATLVALSVLALFESPEDISHWPLSIGVIAFVTLLSIGSQALMVSSLVRNSQQASSVAPLLLIPQLVFGGVLFILKDGAQQIYPAIASRWAMRALGATSQITDLIPGGEAQIARVAGAIDYDSSATIIRQSLSVLLVQTACLLLATLLVLLFHKRNR